MMTKEDRDHFIEAIQMCVSTAVDENLTALIVDCIERLDKLEELNKKHGIV